MSLPRETQGAMALALSGPSLPDGFVPAAKAQVAYWRELCGVLIGAGSAGVRDTEWPADLAPLKPTLTALVERGLMVRRKRAWHLKRHWSMLLAQLRATSVATPRPASPSSAATSTWCCASGAGALQSPQQSPLQRRLCPFHCTRLRCARVRQPFDTLLFVARDVS